MLDTEFERMEAGWLLEEKKMHRLDDEDEGGFSPKHLQQTTMGFTIWDYIDKHHRKTPLFYNFLYSQGDQETVSWVLPSHWSYGLDFILFCLISVFTFVSFTEVLIIRS